MAKTVEEAIQKVNGKGLYLETETQYWVEAEENGQSVVKKVLKPLPKRLIIEKLKNGEFPESYIEEIFKPEKTKALEESLKVEEKGLLLSGKAGIGKTFALIYKIAKDLRYHKVSAPLYITLQDFDVQKEYYTENRLKHYDCFLLDDVNPNLNKLEKRFAERVIYHASRKNKKLYITTNASLRDFFNFLEDEPLVSRILQMCEVKEINETTDLRIKRR
ncbi:ATP-binding protein [Persephonella hydrogeniphila]|nr:ATP-binding protein [Persephonella hydrogeniphila]